jgi:broad specificity phosphatase PhoE
VTAPVAVLWRHGRTAYNNELRLQGQVDIPLDDVGRWQARTAAAALSRACRPTRIVSSDLQRAIATAQYLAELVDLPVELDARLRERDFGQWEGLSRDEIIERWPEEHAAWTRGEEPTRAGAETRAAVTGRVGAALAEHLGRLDRGETLVVVSHGAAITLGLTHLLELDTEDWRGLAGLDNAHWAELHASASHARPRWRLVRHNVGPVVPGVDWNSGPSSA